MAIDFKKYINSTSTHWISNSGGDERGKATGGKAGDQTGREWVLKAWYNRPWGVVLRYPNLAVGIKIAELGIAAALNNHIGYDQVQRKTYWAELVKANYDPSAIKTDCEEDCTAGVTANVKAAGHIFGIKKLEDITTSTYSGNMKKNFVAAGFVALTDKKYLSSPNYLLPGDILLFEGHHAATNVTYGKYTDKTVTVTPTPVAPTTPAPTPTGDAFPDIVVGYVNAYHGNYYIRKTPNKDAEAIGITKTDEHVPYLGEKQDGWFKVCYNGKVGWLSIKAGNIAVATDMTVKPSTWNIRSAPSATAKQLAIASGGDKVSSLEAYDNGWYYIYYKGVTGWISKKAINSTT